MRIKIIPLLAALILFITPFFWLKPGEMDLGGDSSRLYFYDPLSYLQNYSLWSVSPSGFGSENIGFMTIPLVVILAIAKHMVSSTVLISAFHGLSLAISFLFVYLVVRQLLEVFDKNQKATEIASFASGLLYVFSPISILGWDKVLMTHNYVFLNPLLFYLLLRYFVTDRFWYLLWALVVTFIFSANFSFAAAPVFVAFYPLSFIFFFFYKRIVLAQRILWKHVVIALGAFIGIQAFHVLPQIMSMLTPGSFLSAAVFSDQGKFDRGLGYFSAIAPSIKASLNLLLMPQMTVLSKSLLFMIFVPLIVILGFIAKKTSEAQVKKTLLLTGVCFLGVLFFATANITDIGMLLYKKLFILPGFSIFRNFYGQWEGAYLFFYVILFGLALSIVLRLYKRAKILLWVFLFLLVVNAWPFINGRLANKTLWQSKDVKIAMKIDSNFERILAFIKSLPDDGRVLTFPLADPGYQILHGEPNGAYEGPSTISYVAGKNDFAGFSEMGAYGPLFLEYAKRENFEGIKKVIKLFGIKYLFYNSDPKIYDNFFPNFPYDYVRHFLPSDQKAYSEFLLKLGYPLKAKFGQYYHLYEVPDAATLPTIYSPERIWAFDSPGVTSDQLSLMDNQTRYALVNDRKKQSLNASLPLSEHYVLTQVSPFLDFFKTRKESPFPVPYVSKKPSWLFYPYIAWNEKHNLTQFSKLDSDLYIDRLIFYGQKRLQELEKWKDEIAFETKEGSIATINSVWKEPGLVEVRRFREYNQWPTILVRYYRLMNMAIDHVLMDSKSKYTKITNQVFLERTIFEHKEKLLSVVDDIKNITQEDGKILQLWIIEMIDDLIKRFDLSVPEPQKIVYNIAQVAGGRYEILVRSTQLNASEVNSLTIKANDRIYEARKRNLNNWTSFGELDLSGDSKSGLPLIFNHLPNLVGLSNWIEAQKFSQDGNVITLSLANYDSDNKNGAFWPLKNYKGNSTYLVRLKYTTRNSGFSLVFYEAGGSSEKYTRRLKELTLRPGVDRSQTFLFRSGDEVNSAFLQLLRNQGNNRHRLNDGSDQKENIVNISKLEVLELPHPQIILRKVSEQRQDLFTPKIEFKKINSTKYRVLVKEANKPFVLVLMQSFDRRWKITMPSVDNETQNAKGKASRFIAKIMIKITTLLKLSQIHTFETWGQNSFLDSQHFRVNNSVNAWFIRPEDVGGQTEYELTMEMTTQKYFYAGVIISSLTLIGIIVILGWMRFAKR